MDKPKSKRLVVIVESGLFDQLKANAQAEHYTLSEYVRRLLWATVWKQHNAE